MAVAFEARSSPAADGDVGGIINLADATWAHTVTTGDYLRVYVAVVKAGGGVGSPSATFNGVAMTFVDSKTGPTQIDGGQGHCYIFEMVAPPTGAPHNIFVDFIGGAGTAYGAVCGVSYTGVNQSTPSGIAAKANGTSTSAAATASSTSGDMIGACSWGYNIGAEPTPNHTKRQAASAFTGWQYVGAAQDTTASGSVAMSWALSNSTDWAVLAIPIIAVGNSVIGGGGGGTPASPGVRFPFSILNF